MGLETEAKFYLGDLAKIETRLHSLGAQLIQPRTHEINLRFDTPNKDFQRERRVLRLRQDEATRFTYKDGSQLEDGAFSRREIEFIVGDFDSARQFLEALGYVVVFTYEKYRTTYALPYLTTEPFKDPEDLIIHVMLDELPYGDFVEIEGVMDQLKPIAHQLGLNWAAAIPASYHELFNTVCTSRKFNFRDLTYENFKDNKVLPSDLNVSPADEESV
jgi:adenylate cyclase class 2